MSQHKSKKMEVGVVLRPDYKTQRGIPRKIKYLNVDVKILTRKRV